MRVLHVIPSLSERSGGPAQAIVPMCRALQKQGIELLIVSTDSGMDGATQVRRQYDSEVQPYKGIPTRFFPVQIGRSFKYSHPLATWLHRNIGDFDLAHIHAVFNHACIAAANSCRKENVPYIVRPLGTLDPWSMKRKPWRKALFWHLVGKGMLRGAAAVHYTSSTEKRNVETSMDLNNGIIVPLGVELELFEQATDADFFKPSAAHGRRPYVLVLSRLHAKKALDLLIEAFFRVRHDTRFSEWRLVIAGTGSRDYVDYLRKKSGRDINSASVVFTGWLDRDAKLAALRNASLLAMPSHHENFGLCVVEAMASGLPVLVSRCVNLAPIIEGANAGWVSGVDVEELEVALREALSSQGERRQRGRNAKKLSAEFDWLTIGKHLSGLYTRLIRNTL